MMKVKPLFSLMIITVFLLSACSGAATLENNNPALTEPAQPPVTEESGPTEDPATTAPTNETEPAVSSNDICNHPLFPIEDGNTWTYAYGSGEGYTITIEDSSENSFALRQEMDSESVVFQTAWNCSEDGILQADYANVDLLNDAGGADGFELAFETLTWGGETLPPMALLTPGYSWTSHYTLSADVKMEALETTATADVTMQHTLSAIEEVTVLAGTFPDAYRIDTVSTIAMTMNLGGADMPFTMDDISYTNWYVKGVGLVKSDDQFAGYDSNVQLVSSSLLN